MRLIYTAVVDFDPLDELEREVGRISELSLTADQSIRVEHLSRWKVRDVVAHLGGVHRWANQIIVSRSMDGASSRKSKLDGPELCEWFDAGASELIETLRSNDPAEPCPNFNPGSDKVVGWWIRRQLHETTVHRWDIEAALDQVTSIPAERASDGVDEFLDVFVRTRGKHTLPLPMTLRAADTSATWTLSPASKPGRVDVEVDPDSPATAVTVSASAEALLLALWGRPTLESALVIDGDRSVAAGFGLIPT